MNLAGMLGEDLRVLMHWRNTPLPPLKRGIARGRCFFIRLPGGGAPRCEVAHDITGSALAVIYFDEIASFPAMTKQDSRRYLILPDQRNVAALS